MSIVEHTTNHILAHTDKAAINLLIEKMCKQEYARPKQTLVGLMSVKANFLVVNRTSLCGERLNKVLNKVFKPFTTLNVTYKYSSHYQKQ